MCGNRQDLAFLTYCVRPRAVRYCPNVSCVFIHFTILIPLITKKIHAESGNDWFYSFQKEV